MTQIKEGITDMIEDRLNSSLLNIGYNRLDSNAQGVYLFYRAAESGLTIVSVIHAMNGEEITTTQYEHILEQIKANFSNVSPNGIKLLSLILTRYPDRVKQFSSMTAEDSHWIIDLSTNRLMIYETQSNDFEGLKGMIEQLLWEEQSQYREPSARNQYGGVSNPGTIRNVRVSNALPFTLMNMIVIGVNIIAYIITHYTGALGGEDSMFLKGALSWYFVTHDKEYYRLITSMFMHADWSHLINNMIVLLFVGVNLERAAGKLKYILIYFGTGIIAGITSISYNMWRENGVIALGNSTFSIGASGAIFGVVGAVLYIVIVNKGRIAQINTRQMVIFIILSLYGGIINSHIDQAAHVGGFFGGLLLAAILYRTHKNNTFQRNKTF